MTRSNLHIKLSNGSTIICVADSSSAPEQGYFVESVLLPLLSFKDAKKELQLLKEHCTMDERRTNATYRYEIDCNTGTALFFEENYNYSNDRFRKGKDLSDRLEKYTENLMQIAAATLKEPADGAYAD